MKYILIEKCGDCPYFQLYHRWSYKPINWCNKIAEAVRADTIDKDCPLTDYKVTK